MKIEKSLILVVLVAVVAWSLGASDDQVKIGFVDIEQVLATVDKGKAAREELERKSREAQGRIAPMAEQLEALQKEYQAKEFVMSEDAKRQKQLDMVELRNKVENKAKEEQGQLEIEQQRLVQPLLEQLDAVLKRVGRDNDFSTILRIDAPGIVYHREALDVTDLVIKTFNRQD
ncbi:MAG: OmpH family outer membrane protein [Spirochaetaceae bacterium]|nr:OmpH family outer membrane protein [Myxococcales bacterium]MCB9723490.1 OmpH family outer membrane protein [Spirochaetaceae bacterium]